MTENKTPEPQEDPRSRFRRLLDEAEKAEQEVTAAYDLSDAPTDRTIPARTQPSQVEKTELDKQDEFASSGFVPIPMIGAPSDPPINESVSLNDTHLSSTGVTPTKPREETATVPPPPLGTTPMTAPPALDTRGMPLPRRVDEIDIGATQVTSSAYQQQTSSGGYLQSERVISPPRQIDWSSGLGCLLRMIVLGVFVMVILGIGMGSFMVYQYYSIVSAEDWPDVGTLYQNSAQFETTRILDRNGNLLYEILDPNCGATHLCASRRHFAVSSSCYSRHRRQRIL